MRDLPVPVGPVTRIAHTLAQLIEKGSLFKEAFPAGFGSSKNLSFFLLEAWRNARAAQQVIITALRVRVQIRFPLDTS